MKIKNLTVGLLMAGLALSCTGCGGDEVINDKGEKVQSFGQFIEIKSYDFSTSYSNQNIQHFVYDKDTKIVYILYEKPYGIAAMPYYVLNKNDKTEIAIYGENYNG